MKPCPEFINAVALKQFFEYYVYQYDNQCLGLYKILRHLRELLLVILQENLAEFLFSMLNALSGVMYGHCS